MGYKAEPLGRRNLRIIARNFREKLGIEDVLYVNVLGILEWAMSLFFDGFEYEIVGQHELPKKRHADTDVVNRVIRIREDVYEKACNGDGQARMTIMHEIAHYLLIVVCGVKFARSFADERVKAYEDPEWQAKALAGEIMCDVRLVRHKTAEQIKAECGVSWTAANQAYVNCRKA